MNRQLLSLLAAVMLAALPARSLLAQIANLTVVSGANFEPGLVRKGGISTSFCSGLELERDVVATTVPLPNSLAGVRVYVDGFVAPLFAVISHSGFQQINFQVPQESFSGPTAVVMVEQSQRSATIRATRPTVIGGDFFQLAPRTPILMRAANWSLVTKENPAQPGDGIVAWMTGLTQTEPIVPTGYPAPTDPLAVLPQYQNARTFLRYRMLIDGEGEQILFGGLAPGLVGVYQINFRVPISARSGDRQMSLVSESCFALDNHSSCVPRSGKLSEGRGTSGTVTIPIL